MQALWQGAAIGFAIAAPVGPIGLLCIRRTLQGGGRLGLATGLGAALADAGYGMAVAGGLSLTTWLQDHARLLSALGAALLLWLGAGALRAFAAGRPSDVPPALSPAPSSAPSSAALHAAPPRAPAPSVPAAFASTFALTLANPATLVSFVGVIAALGPSAAGSGAAWHLVLGVFLGSLLWWALLVGAVRHARRLVTPRALRWLDLGTGLVLVGTGLWAGSRPLLG